MRRSESACPFCAATLSFEDVPTRVVPSVRLGRAATFAFGATMSAIAGCSSPVVPTGDGAVYGGPPVDAAPTDAGTDAFTGGFDAAYGGPPFDASLHDAATDDAATDDAGNDPLDAAQDAGPSINLYGGAPPP